MLIGNWGEIGGGSRVLGRKFDWESGWEQARWWAWSARTQIAADRVEIESRSCSDRKAQPEPVPARGSWSAESGARSRSVCFIG
eukprot:3977761-Pleurochrysis_carterae.AAC.3